MLRLSHGGAVGLMVLAPLLWSIAGVVTRQLDQAHSFEITFWRSFFTALSLLVILPLWQGLGVFRAMPWRRWAFWGSGLCWSVMFTAFMLALTLTSVANVLVTLALGPLLTALIARLFMGHRLAWRTWLAIAVAGWGVAFIFYSQLQLGQGLAGSLVALCVPVASAVNWTVVQRSRGASIDMVPAVLLGAVIASVLTLPLAFPLQASPADLSWLAALGLFQLAIPCTLAVICARVLQAPEIALLALLEIVFGILWAWLGANEVPDFQVLLGGALVLGALLLNEFLAWRERAKALLASSQDLQTPVRPEPVAGLLQRQLLPNNE